VGAGLGTPEPLADVFCALAADGSSGGSGGGDAAADGSGSRRITRVRDAGAQLASLGGGGRLMGWPSVTCLKRRASCS
jgi:hypothetical protein